MQQIGSGASAATGQSRRRGRPLARVQLQLEQSAELQRRVRAATSTQREALRARIILACADGVKTVEAARICSVHARTVERWRSRFLRLGLKGLKDRPRPGHKPKFDIGRTPSADRVGLRAHGERKRCQSKDYRAVAYSGGEYGEGGASREAERRR